MLIALKKLQFLVVASALALLIQPDLFADPYLPPPDPNYPNGTVNPNGSLPPPLPPPPPPPMFFPDGFKPLFNGPQFGTFNSTNMTAPEVMVLGTQMQNMDMAMKPSPNALNMQVDSTVRPGMQMMGQPVQGAFAMLPALPQMPSVPTQSVLQTPVTDGTQSRVSTLWGINLALPFGVSLVPGAASLGAAQAQVAVLNSSMVTVDQLRANLVLFSAANQVLTGARGQKFIGKPGTVISRKRDVVVLHSGVLIAQSGKNHTAIQTAQGIIDMEEGSSAVIEMEPNRPLRVVPLNTGVSIRGIGKQSEGALAAKVGQELILADQDTADVDLIPVDGLERVVVVGGVERIGGLRSAASSTPIAESTTPTRHAINRAGKSVRLASGTLEEKARSIVSQIQPGWTFGVSSITALSDGTPLQVVVAPNSKFERGVGDSFNLVEGVSLMVAPATMTVRVPLAVVELKKGVIAMLESHNGLCRIKTFGSVGSVKISFHNRYVLLNAGDELVLASHELSQRELNPGDLIARRSNGGVSTVGDVSYAVNDFSIVSFLKLKPCYESLQALDSGKHVISSVMKNAIAVEVVKVGRGQYAYGKLDQRLAAR